MKECKEVLSFLFSLNNAYWKAIEDGSISIGDLVFLYETLKTAGPAIEGIEKVLEEFQNMTAEDLEELKAFVVQEFDIPNDAVEQVIENGVKLVLDVVGFFMKLKTMKAG